MGGVVGRQDERAAFAVFLARAAAGPAAFVIEGEAGIGKSALWQHGVAAAQQAGTVVLACRPARVEANMAFAALTDLLAGVSDQRLAGLPRPQYRALAGAILRDEPAGVDDRTLGLAFANLVRALAAETPVLIAIDDEPWLDASTHDILAFALRRMADTRVGVLTTRRTPESTGSSVADALPADDRDRWRITLRPLSMGVLHHVLRERLGVTFPRPALTRISDTAGGNPLFALELARSLLGSPDAADASVLPVRLRDAVAARLAALSPPAREATLAAALSQRPTPALLGSLALTEGVEEAERAGVLVREAGRLRFSHPLLAAASVDLATAPARRSMHASLASRAVDVETRARHMALATPEENEEVASAAEDAASRAQARGAIRAALELAQLAVDRTPYDEGQSVAVWRRRGLLGRMLHSAGDSAGAYELLATVAKHAPTGELRARAGLVLTEVTFQLSNAVAAQRVAASALADAADDPELKAKAMLQLSELTTDPRDKLRYAESAEAALSGAPSVDPTLLAWARCEVVSSQLLAGEGLDIERLDEALVLERRGRVPTSEDEVATIRPVLLKWDDRLEAALDALHELRNLAQAEGNDGVIPYIVGHESGVLLRLGRLREADRAATEHDEWAAATGQAAQRQQAAYNRALVALHVGDIDRVKQSIADLQSLTEVADSDAWEAMSLAGVTGALAVLEEDWAAAATALDAWYDRLTAAGIREPGVSRFHGEYVEALVAVGRYDRADELTTELLELANRLGRPALAATAWRGRALLAAAHGALTEALRFVVDSLAAEQLRPVPVERGRTLLVKGIIHRRMRAKRAARDAFREAADVFRDAGATGWADRAERELGRTGLRQGDPTELTETERRVAQLASEGLTNRQIAQAAFISVKTVEANLARIYRKLGISSRAQLAARLVAESVQQD